MDNSIRPGSTESEVLDLIEMDGPLTAQEAAGAVYSIDEAYTALETLEENGYVKSERHNPERFGTTAKVWYVESETDRGDQ